MSTEPRERNGTDVPIYGDPAIGRDAAYDAWRSWRDTVLLPQFQADAGWRRQELAWLQDKIVTVAELAFREGYEAAVRDGQKKDGQDL